MVFFSFLFSFFLLRGRTPLSIPLFTTLTSTLHLLRRKRVKWVGIFKRHGLGLTHQYISHWRKEYFRTMTEQESSRLSFTFWEIFPLYLQYISPSTTDSSSGRSKPSPAPTIFWSIFLSLVTSTTRFHAIYSSGMTKLESVEALISRLSGN